MKQFSRKTNLSALILLMILSTGFAFLCFITSAAYHYPNYYMLFYVIALILSVICAVKIRTICKPLWVFALVWNIFLFLFVFWTRDLYITTAFWLFYVIILAVLWSYIAYYSFFNSQKRYPLIGWLSIFIALNLVIGWAAWASGDHILSKKHARNLLICREKTLRIVKQIKEYQETHGSFPKTLDEMNLSPELTNLPLTELQYEVISDIHFSLGFDDILHASIHQPGSYEYVYVKIDNKPFRDGWGTDPIETIRHLDASIAPEKN